MRGRGGEADADGTKKRMRLRDVPEACSSGYQYCEEHKKLIDKQYDQFARSPDHHKKYGRAWKRIRDRYVMEHPFCELCMKEGKFTPVEEVHHILPVSRGGRHNRENLMSLCQSCHNKIHHKMGDR